ncbi:MAG TPA: DNA circularization N-terminal domain-containing protein, partial [Polyangiaceae bacterium]|nr:DNA circularization N-terminal domain-containing protein [Polyangiaceae bacterium]
MAELFNTYFDTLPFTSFNGIVFMAERIKLYSTGRQHIHEFPHAPGGAPEKLGRGLWYLSVQANFQTTFAAYPNLYPDAMLSLRRMYEAQITGTFVHPTSGQFDAFISKWDQDYEPGRIRSGEKVQIEFLEDQRSLFLTQATENVASTQMAMAQSNVDAGLAALKDTLRMTPTDLSVFDAVRAAVNTVQSLQSTVSLYSQILNAKAQELVSNCQQADQLFS